MAASGTWCTDMNQPLWTPADMGMDASPISGAHMCLVVSMTKWSGTRPPLAGSEIRPSIGNDTVR
jgi:hypothetical protein